MPGQPQKRLAEGRQGLVQSLRLGVPVIERSEVVRDDAGQTFPLDLGGGLVDEVDEALRPARQALPAEQGHLIRAGDALRPGLEAEVLRDQPQRGPGGRRLCGIQGAQVATQRVSGQMRAVERIDVHQQHLVADLREDDVPAGVQATESRVCRIQGLDDLPALADVGDVLRRRCGLVHQVVASGGRVTADRGDRAAEGGHTVLGTELLGVPDEAVDLVEMDDHPDAVALRGVQQQRAVCPGRPVRDQRVNSQALQVGQGRLVVRRGTGLILHQTVDVTRVQLPEVPDAQREPVLRSAGRRGPLQLPIHGQRRGRDLDPAFRTPCGQAQLVLAAGHAGAVEGRHLPSGRGRLWPKDAGHLALTGVEPDLGRRLAHQRPAHLHLVQKPIPLGTEHAGIAGDRVHALTLDAQLVQQHRRGLGVGIEVPQLQPPRVDSSGVVILRHHGAIHFQATPLRPPGESELPPLAGGPDDAGRVQPVPAAVEDAVAQLGGIPVEVDHTRPQPGAARTDIAEQHPMPAIAAGGDGLRGADIQRDPPGSRGTLEVGQQGAALATQRQGLPIPAGSKLRPALQAQRRRTLEVLRTDPDPLGKDRAGGACQQSDGQ